MNVVLNSQKIKEFLKEDINERHKGIDSSKRWITVIDGYGKRDGFFGGIAGIFYRIWNAVKAIFGRSDWQLAKNDLASEARKEISIIPEIGEPFLKHLPKGLLNKIEKFEVEVSERMAEGLLQITVDTTYQKTFTSCEEIKVYLDNQAEKRFSDFKNSITKIKEGLDKEIEDWKSDFLMNNRRK